VQVTFSGLFVSAFALGPAVFCVHDLCVGLFISNGDFDTGIHASDVPIYFVHVEEHLVRRIRVSAYDTRTRCMERGNKVITRKTLYGTPISCLLTCLTVWFAV
jgi:hypothetical protein